MVLIRTHIYRRREFVECLLTKSYFGALVTAVFMVSFVHEGKTEASRVFVTS